MGRAFFRSLLESGNESLGAMVFVVVGLFGFAMAWVFVSAVSLLALYYLCAFLYGIWFEPMKTRVGGYLFIVALGACIYFVTPLVVRIPFFTTWMPCHPKPSGLVSGVS